MGRVKSEDERAVRDLLTGQRWAALATIDNSGDPFASKVACVQDPAAGGLLMHLSELAEHTRNLAARPGASLVIGQPDLGEGDPQTLARLSVAGRVERVEPDSADFPGARARYIARLPDAEVRFGFADFVLLRLVPARGQFVGGFARARSLSAATLARLIASA